MTTCKIQWIDEHGKPTPDSNPAIGEVWREAHVAQINGRGVRMEESEHYPICAEHMEQYRSARLSGEHWTFEPEEERKP